ncbi:hypothetical protein HPB48_008485 [Haemaphysalis longicornis]|uniref:RING-type domain-containing protein n=1 Tax=Haemaphysalis longicornis TaxID=44386 RepID=A0A9J6FMJ0_HAELO|nr:hypothetical protein HPB48_008485 [Haemaphysalis longicornis]
MGIDESLDWRPLEFVDKIPEALVCTLCGVIPAFLLKILSCCHVFCPACYEKITQRERICPVDRRSFLSDVVESLGSSRAGLKELRVRCPNSARGCTFVGKLFELKHHFLEQCRLGGVQCPQCEVTMPQTEALDHYLQHFSGSPAGMPGVARKSTSFNLESEAAAPGVSSPDNSSGFSGGSSLSRSRRRRKKRGDESSKDPKASSAETVSAAAVGKDPLVAMIRDYLQDDAASSVRSVSSGSSRGAPRESTLVHSSSNAKPCLHKMPKASKRMDGVSKVPSEEEHFMGKVDSAISNADKALSTASTSNEQQSSTSGASSMPTTAKPTQGPPLSKTPASAAPPGFAFCYVTGLEDVESRLICGEEVVLRSDSFPMADCCFRVHGRLRRDKDGVVLASFALFVCGGTWQRIAEWSLSIVVNLVLVHPWDQSRNKRLPLVPNPDAVPMPPNARLGRWDFWSPTEEFELRDLKGRGFLSSDSVCIAVEVEGG